jgi:thiol-disulfide isomerase/thioredoxin
MFVGDTVDDIEAESWITEKPDLSSGKYIIHFWTPSCLRCHTEVEILAEIAKHRDIQILVLNTPRYEFEDQEYLEGMLENKNITCFAAHEPQANKWRSEHTPKKIIIQDGEIKYHSTGDHKLTGLEKPLEIKTTLETPHTSEEKYLGLKNSGITPEQRFYGEKEVEETKTYRKISLSGRWLQGENFIESKGENSSLTFTTDKTELYATVDPKESIRDIQITVDGELDRQVRIKQPGITNLMSLNEGRSHVELDAEEGLRLYKIDLA